jgi:ubiquinol-cytochrome c reductase cytochrome c subunit
VRWAWGAAGLVVLALGAGVGGSRAVAQDTDEDRNADRARQLYVTGCSSCHGIDGGGTEDGPSLENAGAAAAFYYLETGRMPLADVDEQPKRKPPAYSEKDIELLVDYVAALGNGPVVPDVDRSRGDLAEGGELYRENCAPCHSAAGIGGALSYGRAAPSVHSAAPPVIGAAVRVGPGQMPEFGPDVISDDELDDVVRYVRYLASPPTPGGAALGGAGPIPEGFVAWLFGIGAVLLATRWIGRSRADEDVDPISAEEAR